MAESNEIRLIIRAEIDKALGDMKKFNQEMVNTQKSTSSLVSAMKGFVSIGAITGALRFVIQETIEAQKVNAQLEAVLKSTGHAAGLMKEEIVAMADKLKGLTAIDDETIISGQNLLLTFTRIGRDVFPQATEAMLDMSVALGQDVKASAIQLGKALNDPILGVTALRRVGIQLTAQQQEQIKSFMAVNNIAAAQKVILGELANQMGGSAAAQANTLGGSLNKIKIAMGDIAEVIGNLLAPDIQMLAGLLSDLASGERMSKLNSILTWAWEFGKAVQRLVIGIGTLGASEIYRAYKMATEEKTSAMGFVTGAASKTLVTPRTPQIPGTDSKLLEEARKAREEYMSYVDQFNQGLIQKENNKFAELQKLQGNAYFNQEDLLRAHHENLNMIEEQAMQKKFELFSRTYNQISGIVSQSMAGLNAIFNQQSQNEQNKITATYNKRKLIINALVKDEKTRNDMLQALDLMMEVHKNHLARREFERAKIMSISSIWVNAGLAIMGAWSSAMMPQSNGGVYYLGIALAAAGTAIITAMAAAQTAMVMAQQAPALAGGGLIQGSQSGTHIIAGEGGRSEAILPLENPEVMRKLGGMGGATYNVYFEGVTFASDDLPDSIMKAIDRGMYKLTKQKNSVFAGAL